MNTRDLASLINSVAIDELNAASGLAEALWRGAGRRSAQGEMLDEYESLVSDVLDRQPALEQYFRLHGGGQEKTRSILEAVFKDRASELLYEFLRLLDKHRALGLLRAVWVNLVKYEKEAHGRVPVAVASARALSDEQRDRLASLLADKLKITPEMTCEVDPGLVAGLRVRVGDTVYNRSAKWDLMKLRDQLTARGVNEV